jgi:ribonuclease D
MNNKEGHSSPVSYVSSAAQLEDCINKLAEARLFAIDLEFDRDHYTYGFDLCLMQVATPDHCFLIDPKRGVAAEKIFPLLEADDIQKIAHCSGEDLRLLHSMNCIPQNIVDTEIYAKLLNYERTSLSAMLQLFFDVELNKKMQKINWNIRPLTDEQIHYAANDVLYLVPLKNILEKEAVEKGLLNFIVEENQLLSTTIHSNAPKTNFLKQNDMRFLSAYDQHVLNEMFRYRDGIARKFNKPAHHIIKESLLRTIALGKDEIPAELDAVHYSLKSANGRKDFFHKLETVKQEARTRELDKRKSNRPDRKNAEPFANGFSREWIEEQRANFKLIQNAIAEKYGEHSMRFIFSSTLVTALLTQQTTLKDLKTDSRKKIIRETAKSLQVDLAVFE